MSVIESALSIKKIIGARLSQARSRKHLTREQLCDRVNGIIYSNNSLDLADLTVSTYRYWESGDHQINIEYIPILATVLDFDMGYLFGEYPTLHRESADICSATLLSEAAVESLKSHSESSAYYRIKGKKPQEILSAFLTDPEFWQILNSLFQYSNPDTLSLIDNLLSTSSAYALPSNDPYSEDVLIMDTGRETMIAGVSRHFGNVAERAIGWDKKNQ